MYQLILSSLSRQDKGLQLLQSLLEQEYRLICKRKLDAVSHAEFAIQELIRQLVVEKEFVIGLLKGTPLSEYAATLEEDQAGPLREALAHLDEVEQKSSRQATRNSQLVLALLDQNAKSMDTLFKQAVPERSLVYGRSGAMHRVAAQGALISGRL